MASRVVSVVKRHPQIAFFVLAYAVAWAFVPFGSFGAFGPLVAALVVIPLTRGWAGLRELGSRLIRWRVRWFWYLVALGLPLAIHLVTAGLHTAAVVMLVGIVRTVLLLRRWHIRPESRPRGRWAMALRVWLPFVTNVGWGLALLLVFPKLAYPLQPTMLIVPDLGYLVVASALAALTWGILRTVLVYIALRRRGASRPAQTSTPATAVTPVGR